MSLLSILGQGWDDPKSAAFLQLAAGLQGGRNLSQGLTQGALGFQQSMSQSKREQERKAQQLLQEQLLQAQIEETRAQAGQRQSAAAEAQRKAQQQAAQQKMLLDALSVSPINANAASGVSGPRPEALQSVGQRPQIDYQRLIAQGIPGEVVKQLAESQNYGRPEVARTIKGMVNGREQEQQFDKFGAPVGAGMEQYRAPLQADTGAAVNFLDPYSLTPISTMGKTMSPGERDASARGWAGLKETRENNRRVDERANAGGLKGLTEAQAKATAFLGQMRAADMTLGQVGPNQNNMIEQANVMMASTPLNMLASSKGQETRQAQEQWAEAFLRFKTGAASTEGEVKRNVKTFFPQLGDSQAVIDQKARMREQAIADIALVAGKGAGASEVVPSITSRNSTGGAFGDAEKERRYQEWKARQGK